VQVTGNSAVAPFVFYLYIFYTFYTRYILRCTCYILFNRNLWKTSVFMPEEVESAIKSLKMRKAPGVYKITA